MNARQEFEFKSSWPATTISGEPGIVEGLVDVVLDPDGSALLSGSTGEPGADAKDCDYFEFQFSPGQARKLGWILSSWPGR